jgi:ADP-heptose:LPS heptosyltransferase
MGAKASSPLPFPLPTGDPLPRFDEYPPFILFHPFARGGGKSLSDAVVAEICRLFSPARVGVVGRSKLRITAPENCVDLSGQTTLLQLVRLIRTAGFVISVDSGPMHIAAAVTDRLVSIHTWTDPRRVGPYNSKAWIWRDGYLLQMRDFVPTGKIKAGRRFRPSDAAQIVELAQRFVAKQD